MDGVTLLALIVVAIIAFIAYRVGATHARRRDPAVQAPHAAVAPASFGTSDAVTPASPSAATPQPVPPEITATPRSAQPETTAAIRDELARLVRSYEADAARLRDAIAELHARRTTERELEGECSRLAAALANARAEIERYRRIVVDIENNAPPLLLDGPGTPDDLKLIVGIGPVLERMLHQLGVGTYRQIARWSERDIDEIDAKLPEFPGRIRRDAWVTQARELHMSKYGERP